MKIGELSQFQVTNCVGIITCDDEDVDPSVFIVGCHLRTIAKDCDVWKCLIYRCQEIITKVLIGP